MEKMDQRDYKKEFAPLYSPSAQAVSEVDVPVFNFLMVDGAGDPNESPEYAAAVEALFAVAYAAKFMVKKSPAALDYAVMPLEGLWWATDMDRFSVDAKADWLWTMMIMQPPCVDRALAEAAIAETVRKKKLAAQPRWESFAEGRCAQILHIGPFSEEGPNVRRVHDYIDARGARRGKHHEIYLSDIRHADPRKWRTVIRQPMA